jgi:uncharacterized protein DUF6049
VRRLGLLLVAVTIVLPAPPAQAQDQAEVGLFLTDQTPYVTPDLPLRVAVRATNGTDIPYQELSLAVTVWSAARTRSGYAEALDSGPVSPIGVKVFPVQGPLGAGEVRSFSGTWPHLPFLVARDESALYPVTIELRSSDAQIAILRTSIVFILDPPKVPLSVSISFVLDAPIRLRPDGVLLDDGIEEQIVPGGRLEVEVAALEEVPVAVTVVVSPVLLEVLQDMRDGYGVEVAGQVEDRPADHPVAVAAGRLLDRLREVARRTTTTEVVALPYASPSVPALTRAGLEEDLAAQIDRGRAAVAGILGVQPSATVFRPPASAISPEALGPLAQVLGSDGTTEALLLDDNVVPPRPGLELTPVGTTQVTADETTLTAIAPDPVVEQRTATGDDPRLRAMWTLGELSAIYFERPSEDRGIAVVFGEGEAPPGAFLRALLRGIQAEPSVRWLRAVKATRVAVGQDPDAPAQPRELQVPARSAALSPTFVADLTDARDAVAALASMADQPPVLDQLRRDLLLSESRYLAGHEEDRLALLRAADEAVAGEFAKIRPPVASSITLTSRGGIIPVTLQNAAGYPVELQLTLRSARLRFVGGGSRQVRLERPVQQFVFPVQAQTTGRFPVRVELQTPDGEPISFSRIVVRSTAYNRVALVITAGAALFLALWWGRRLLSRRSA